MSRLAVALLATAAAVHPILQEPIVQEPAATAAGKPEQSVQQDEWLAQQQQQLERQQLESVGPVVVNKDGSLGRIANWKELAQSERAAALRAVSRRNRKRLEDAAAKKAASRTPPRRLWSRLVGWVRNRSRSRGKAEPAAAAVTSAEAAVIAATAHSDASPAAAATLTREAEDEEPRLLRQEVLVTGESPLAGARSG